LDDKVDLTHPLDRLCLDGASCLEGGDAKSLVAFIKAMEFTSLLKRVVEATGIDADEIAADPKLAPGSQLAGVPAETVVEEAEKPAAAEPVVARTAILIELQAFASVFVTEIAGQKVDRARYASLGDAASLDQAVAKAFDRGRVAVDLVTTSADPMIAELIGISLAIEPGEACYIPLGHRGS